MNAQEVKAAQNDRLQDITYKCYMCEKGEFHYQGHKPDIAYKLNATDGKLKVVLPNMKSEEQTIELPWLARFFLFFIDFFKNKNSAPEHNETEASYVCVYDKKCEIYYRIPYEVK